MVMFTVLLITLAIAIVSAAAETLHGLRINRLKPLAFGSIQQPVISRYATTWAFIAGFLRVASISAVCWGLLTLMMLSPKVHRTGEHMEEQDYRHLVLVLDVSPSMRLQDSGPENDMTRRKRVFSLMQSFFKRVGVAEYKISIIGVYTEAKPVVVDTKDLEVVRNVLDELPMEYAFKAGKTDIFSGLQQAADIARPWRPRSTTVILLTDGDTVPASGMPKMPSSVSDVVVVGVGDPVKGKFINGTQSRQDASTLRQVAARLSGTYHNGNENHLSTALIRKIAGGTAQTKADQWSLREYALLAIAAGAGIYALLPILLHFFGSLWNPGTQHRARKRHVAKSRRSLAASR